MNAVSRQHSGASMSNNPFATGQVAPRAGQNAVAEASPQREIAEVQAAMGIAKRFPRNPIEALDRRQGV